MASEQDVAAFLDLDASEAAPEPAPATPARGRGRGRGRARGRGRGRAVGALEAPVELPVRAPPGDDSYAAFNWSCTIAVRGGDVPGSWLPRMVLWIQTHCLSGAAAFEIGGQAKRLHIQAAFRVKSERTDVFKKFMTDHIKDFIPIQRGMAGTVAATPFGDTQAWTPMLGYLQKDQGQGHYQIQVHNITQAELAEGRQAYNHLKLDYEDGKIVLSKTAFFKTCYREWYTQLRPLDVEIDRLLFWLLQSGDYTISSQWISGPNGTGLAYAQARAMWKICRNPTTVTMDTIHNLFFYDRWKRRRILRPNDVQYNVSFEEAKQMAQAARETGNIPQPPVPAIPVPVDEDGLPLDEAEDELPIVIARRFMREYADGLGPDDSQCEWFLDHLSDVDWITLGSEFDRPTMEAAFGIEVPESTVQAAAPDGVAV